MTAPDLPAPLVPAEVDLRDFGWMPIDIARLFGSEFHARSSDTAWRAGVTLWLKAYHQVPAGSIPDDDVAMARLAELGRDLKTWRKIKADVLRGWVRCNDGRFHHPVVAEKALEAWIEKLVQRKASAAGNARRYSAAFDAAPFEAAVTDSLARLAALNPNSRTLSKRVPKGAAKHDGGSPMDPSSGDENAPDGTPASSHREAGSLPPGGRKPPTGKPERSRSEAGNLLPGSQGTLHYPTLYPQNPLRGLYPRRPPRRGAAPDCRMAGLPTPPTEATPPSRASPSPRWLRKPRSSGTTGSPRAARRRGSATGTPLGGRGAGVRSRIGRKGQVYSCRSRAAGI